MAHITACCSHRLLPGGMKAAPSAAKKRLLAPFIIILAFLLRHSAGFTTTCCKASIRPSSYCRNNFVSRCRAASTSLSDLDAKYLQEAIDCAKQGLGHTFPNPAVGCVLVNHETDAIVGRGFHPRSGYPHAEVFALLEAGKHVADGVAAAQAVVDRTNDNHKLMLARIEELTEIYKSDEGPSELFEDIFSKTPVTAYVTLEPCCHVGQTPPCAMSLALASVDRVVVGFRDPNPRVDGGGVSLLTDEFGTTVDLVEVGDPLHQACANLVASFCKRITPIKEEDDIVITGGMRRGLRALANRRKSESSLPTVVWTGPAAAVTSDGELDIDSLVLSAEWMEELDDILWKGELVNVRLNSATKKRKSCKELGTRIADALGAHVAQSVGHTILLYRPGSPPVLDLREMVGKDSN